MLQYTVGFLNAAGHDRGGVVWLKLTLELDLVGFVWPFCGFMSRFSRVYGAAGRVFGGQGCLGRDARSSGRRRQTATRASTTPERKADAGLPRAHCGGKGRNSLSTPSGLIHPTRFPNQHVAAWVPSHTGAKRTTGHLTFTMPRKVK